MNKTDYQLASDRAISKLFGASCLMYEAIHAAKEIGPGEIRAEMEKVSAELSRVCQRAVMVYRSTLESNFK